MSDVLVLNQGLPHAQDTLIFTSVALIKWQLTAALVSSGSMHRLLCYLTGTGCIDIYCRAITIPVVYIHLTGRPMYRSTTNLF